MPAPPALRARVGEFQLEAVARCNVALVCVSALRNVFVRELPRGGVSSRVEYFRDIHRCWDQLQTLRRRTQAEWQIYLVWIEIARRLAQRALVGDLQSDWLLW